jgi:hypothetical protein
MNSIRAHIAETLEQWADEALQSSNRSSNNVPATEPVNATRQ